MPDQSTDEKVRKMEEESDKLKQEAKRLRLDTSHVSLLSGDLEKWFEKLATSASKTRRDDDRWVLCFLSRPYHGLLQAGWSSYVGTDFEKYLSSHQNMGPSVVAYAKERASLFPASTISTKRLILFGFHFLIMPAETCLDDYDTTSKMIPDLWMDFSYGYLRQVDPLQPIGEMESRFGIDKPDMREPTHVDIFYKNLCTRLEEYCVHDVEIAKLEEQIDALVKERDALVDKKVETRTKFAQTQS